MQSVRPAKSPVPFALLGAQIIGGSIRIMNFHRLLLITGLSVATAPIVFAQDKPPVPLPSDPSAVVITMDRQGGFQLQPRTNRDPVLTIHADGRVLVVGQTGRTSDKQIVLPPAEIQELLQFIVVEQDFFAFNAADVRQAIESDFRKTGRGVSISDASDTVIRIAIADKDQEARYNALSFWADRYPGIKALGQLRAIELRLNHLEATVRADGTSETEDALERANAYLKEARPAIPALSLTNLVGAETLPGGIKRMRFERYRPGDPANIAVTVTYLQNAIPQVTEDFP